MLGPVSPIKKSMLGFENSCQMIASHSINLMAKAKQSSHLCPNFSHETLRQVIEALIATAVCLCQINALPVSKKLSVCSTNLSTNISMTLLQWHFSCLHHHHSLASCLIVLQNVVLLCGFCLSTWDHCKQQISSECRRIHTFAISFFHCILKKSAQQLTLTRPAG